MKYTFGTKEFTLGKPSYAKKQKIKDIIGDDGNWVLDFGKAMKVLQIMVNEDVSVITIEDIDDWSVLDVYTDFFTPKSETLEKLLKYNPQFQK
jgi:hypothetical protein